MRYYDFERGHTVLMMCVAAMFLLAVSSAAQQTTLARESGKGAKYGVSAHLIPLTRIDDREFQEYLTILEMPESQHVTCHALFDKLQVEYARIDKEHWDSIKEQAKRIGEIVRSGAYLPDTSRLIQLHYDQQRAANQEAIDQEELFVEAIEDLVSSKESDGRLVRVQLLRQRSRYIPRGETVPGASLDTLDILAKLNIPCTDCWPFLNSYENSLGELRKRRYEEDLYRRIYHSRFLSERSLTDDPTAVNDRAIMLRRLVRIDMRLRRLNIVVLEQLRTCLDKHDAEVLIDATRCMMYPTIFPDRRAHEALAKARKSRDSFPTDSNEYRAFEELIDDFKVQYEAIVSLMIEAVVSNQERFESLLASYDEDEREYERVLVEFSAKRDSLSEELALRTDELLVDIHK